jgi:membrane-associated phospholipid phosphatase
MIHYLLDLDRSIFLSSQSIVPQAYATIIHILGEAIVVAGGVFLVTLWLVGIKKHDNEYKKNALRIFSGITWVFILYSIINMGLPQWRVGAMELSGATALIPHPTDNSFPSGHALFSAALIVWIWRYYHRYWLLILFIVLALITTISRVLGWVHYPGDILGGLFFGSIGAILLTPIIRSSWMEKNIYPLCIKIAKWVKL